jgi:hypothetical protein
MSYQITKTDGTIVATVADGQLDNQSTDLTLIGKNYSGFGSSINENFVKLLENFSNSSAPLHPITGQIWFDTAESKLKVYSGTQFVPVSSATISNTQPATLGVGDLWFNNIDKQLFFFDGTNTTLLAPAYTASQGLSGFQVQSILDTLNQTRVVTFLYTNGILLGIFSKDSFTPKTAITGFTGSIVPGFNAGSLSGITFNVTASNAIQLNGVAASNYVRSDTANIINGQLKVTTDLGIITGRADQASLRVSSGDVQLSNSASNRDLYFIVRKDITPETAVHITSGTRTIDLYPGQTDSSVNVGGSLTVTGNLTVNGTTTTINTNNLNVEDKQVILAYSSSNTYSDTLADQGGIVLQGSTAHAFVWSQNTNAAGTDSQTATNNGYSDALPATLSTAWNSSDHINVASGKYFAIGGVPVITGNSLGPSITSIPGVTSFGAQTTVTIGTSSGGTITPVMTLSNNAITVVKASTDLSLVPPLGNNIALSNSPKITGLADPGNPQDAATKNYVDTTVKGRNLAFSIDLSDNKDNAYIITNILTTLAPPSEYQNGTYARVLCNILANASTTIDVNSQITQSTSVFTTPTGTAPAVTNVAIQPVPVVGETISTSRVVKTFQIIAGVWVFVSDTTLPA